MTRSLGTLAAVPGELPLLGSYRPFLRDPLRFLTRASELGPMCRFGFLGRPRVAVFDPELVHGLLVGAAQHTRETSIFGVGAPREIYGSGILTSEGADRARHRRRITAAFQGRLLEGYQRAFADLCSPAIEDWRRAGEVEVVEATTSLMESSGLWLFFGLTGRPDEEPVVRAVRDLTRVLGGALDLVVTSKVPFDVPALSRGGTARRALGVLDRWLRSRAAGDGSEPGEVSFASAMLRDTDLQERGALEEVRSDLLQLFYAGYETTGASAAWTLYLLARHPAEADLVRDELARVVGARPPTLAELDDRLPHLDSVVRESLRLYPPATFGVRRSSRDLELGGVGFPAGTLFVTSAWVTHRARGAYADPEAFRPERFRGGESAPRGAYIPFGIGPNSCIGAALARMEVKTAVAMALRDHRLELVPGQTIRPAATPLVRPAPGVRVTLRPHP